MLSFDCFFPVEDIERNIDRKRMKFALQLTMIDLFLLWLELIFHTVSSFVYSTYHIFISFEFFLLLLIALKIKSKFHEFSMNKWSFLFFSSHESTFIYSMVKKSALFKKSNRYECSLSHKLFCFSLLLLDKDDKKMVETQSIQNKNGQQRSRKWSMMKLQKWIANFAIRRRVTAIVPTSWRFSISKVT